MCNHQLNQADGGTFLNPQKVSTSASPEKVSASGPWARRGNLYGGVGNGIPTLWARRSRVRAVLKRTHMTSMSFRKGFPVAATTATAQPFPARAFVDNSRNRAGMIPGPPFPLGVIEIDAGKHAGMCPFGPQKSFHSGAARAGF